MFSPEHRILNPYSSEEMRGPETMKGLIWFTRKILPDLEVVVEDETAEGEKVTTRWTLSGNLADELRAYDIDGEVTVSGISVSRVIGGKIQETRLRCEAYLQEPRRPVPRDEFLKWLRGDTPTSKREAPDLGLRPVGPNIPDWVASKFCCIIGIKWCCHETQPPATM